MKHLNTHKKELHKSPLLISSQLFAKVCYTLLLTALTLPISHGALKGSVTIEADEAYFDQLSGKTEYSGDVVVVQDTMRLLADKVTVVVNDGKIAEATAIGTPAKLERNADDKTERVNATANTITYKIINEIILLSGNALLTQAEGHELSGGTIRYDINQQRIQANSQGNRRVKITLPPDSKGFDR